MLEWISVTSARVTAISYDPESQTIFVEFPNGKRWWYSGCDQVMWEEFSNPLTSKGNYIHTVLNTHPNGPYDG